MRHLLVLIAALMATTAIAKPITWVITDAAVLENVKPIDAKKYRTVCEAWNMLCFDLRDVDCTGVPVPKVMTFSTNPARPGLAGYYKGGDVIYVRNNLGKNALEEVLAHEMSHYMDVIKFNLPVPGPALEICFSEKRAWAVSDNYNRMYGKKSRIVGETWVEWYTHCTPYRDVLYPKVNEAN